MEESDRSKRSNSQKDGGPETEGGEDLESFLRHDPLPRFRFGVKVITSKGTYVKGSLQKKV